MPAPSFLKGLPKPLLFGLYGAVGGLLGAIVFAEPLYRVLMPPPPPPPPPPEPQLAVAVSPDVTVYTDGSNTFGVKVARAEFDGPVTVRFENVPTGVSIDPVVIPQGSTEATATVRATRTSSPTTSTVRVVAEARVGDKSLSANNSIPVTVAEPPRPQADVFFIMDVTGSMDWAIAGVRDGIGRFAAEMNRNRIDFRVGLVAFRDRYEDVDWLTILRFRDETFTNDVYAFRDLVGRLSAYGGGDAPESSLEAIEAALDQPFRRSATKVLLLITDNPPKVVDQSGRLNLALIPEAVRQTADRIRARGIDSVHLVVPRNTLRIYEPLREAGSFKKGEFFELAAVASGTGFSRLIDDFGRVVTEVARAKNPEGELQVGGVVAAPELGIRAVQASREFAKGTEVRLTVAVGVWTGAIAALICLALLTGQHHYLRGSWPGLGSVIVALVGGLAAGLIGGAAGQGLYFLAPDQAAVAHLFRGIGWAVLGGLAGAGLALFIPNLRPVHGLAGGALGGAVGCAGYILVEGVAGELAGRLVGGLVLGFCIGLMVAVVEVAFRRAWLEVRYGARETITVNLGPEPVKVGGDARACTVWARGAAGVALRYFVRDGRVVCEDVVGGRAEEVAEGDSRVVGGVTVTVRLGSGAVGTPLPSAVTAPSRAVEVPSPVMDSSGVRRAETSVAGSVPAGRTPSPPPKPALQTGTSGEVTNSKAQASRISKPPELTRPPQPPKPSVAAAAAPPPGNPKISPSPESRHPDACPSCGRVNPGKPNQRYCLVCDQIY